MKFFGKGPEKELRGIIKELSEQGKWLDVPYYKSRKSRAYEILEENPELKPSYEAQLKGIIEDIEKPPES